MKLDMDVDVYCYDCGDPLDIEEQYYNTYYDQPRGYIVKVRSHDCGNRAEKAEADNERLRQAIQSAIDEFQPNQKLPVSVRVIEILARALEGGGE